MAANRETGTICYVSTAKGFGFISRKDADDVFFHCTEIPEDLPFSDQLRELPVTFSVVTVNGRDRAVDVRKVH